MIKNIRFIILLITICIPHAFNGQTSNNFPLENDIHEIENIIEQIKTIFEIQKKKQEFTITQIPKINIGEAGNKYYYYAKRYFNARTGLEVSFGYNHKLAKETVDTDGEDYAPYNDRYQLTLSWDLMRSAILGRQLAFRRIDIITDQIKNNLRADSLASLSLANSISIRNKLIPAMRHVLSLKVELQESLLKLDEKLYNNRKIKYSDLATRKETLFQTRTKLRNLPIDSNDSINIDKLLPDLNIYKQSINLPDTAKIFHNMINKLPELKNYTLEQELLKLDQRESTIWRRIRIVPYVRGQYYNYKEGDNRINLDLGFNVQVPIDVLDKRYKKVLGCQIDNNKTQQQSNMKNIIGNIKVKYDELKTLNKVWLSEYQLLQELQETIKSAEIAYKEQELSIQQLSVNYDNYLSQLTLLYNLIEQREQLYFELTFK